MISAGGGGHTGFAVSLAQRLKGKADMLFVVPKGDWLSRRRLERYGYVVETTKPRHPNESFAKLALLLPKALIESLMRVPGGEVFVSTGSNHCVAPAIVAKIKGSKIYNLEGEIRFTRPSLTARWLKPISDVTVLQWPEQRRLHPDGKVYGPFYELPEYEIRDEGYIVVTGGTYGFCKLFDIVYEMGLDKVVLQTGKSCNPRKYIRSGWTVFDVVPDFNKYLAGASLVISHYGKTALDAALTYRKPVIIIPNPEWKVHRELMSDAEILAEKLNAVLIKNLTKNALEEAIEEAGKRSPPVYSDGAKLLAEDILELLS